MNGNSGSCRKPTVISRPLGTPEYKAQYQKTAANAFFFLHKMHWTIRCNKSDKILICFLHVLNLKEMIKQMNKKTFFTKTSLMKK